MKKTLKKYNYLIKGIFAFILFFSSSFIQNILANILPFKQIKIKEAVIINCISSGIIVIILFILYRNDLKKEWKIFKDNLSDNLDIGFKYWIMGLFGMMISNIIISFVLKAGQANNEQTVQEMISALPYLVLISAGIFAPFNEEILFRKVFKDNIKYNTLFILISSLFFGYLHVAGASSLTQFLYIIPYSSLGVSFAIMYIKTDSVFTSMSMHMIHNLALTILSIMV